MENNRKYMKPFERILLVNRLSSMVLDWENSSEGKVPAQTA